MLYVIDQKSILHTIEGMRYTVSHWPVIQNRPTVYCVVVKVGQCHSHDGNATK